MNDYVMYSDEIMPYLVKALGISINPDYVKSINLYLERGGFIDVSVEMLGTEKLKDVQWAGKCNCYKPSLETKTVPPGKEDLHNHTADYVATDENKRHSQF